MVCDLTDCIILYHLHLSFKSVIKHVKQHILWWTDHRTRLDQLLFQGPPRNHKRVSDVRHCLACVLHDDVQLPPRPSKGQRTVLAVLDYNDCMSLLHTVPFLILSCSHPLFHPIPSRSILLQPFPWFHHLMKIGTSFASLRPKTMGTPLASKNLTWLGLCSMLQTLLDVE